MIAVQPPFTLSLSPLFPSNKHDYGDMKYEHKK